MLCYVMLMLCYANVNVIPVIAAGAVDRELVDIEFWAAGVPVRPMESRAHLSAPSRLA